MRTSAANLFHADPANAGSRPWHAGQGRHGLLLLALCLVVYLPGLASLPAVDRDESRFAQASRQMFESVALPASQREPALHGGGVVIPRVQGKDRLNKPPLIYWLQSASAAAFTAGDPLRDAIWMYRVPSVIAAIVAVLATWRLGVSMLGPRVGALAAAMLAVCPVVAWEAHQARADMVLLACTTSAMWALWELTNHARATSPEPVTSPERERRALGSPRASRSHLSLALAFWLAVALGIMTKGPITPMIGALTVVGMSVCTRRWRWMLDLRPLLGLVVVAAVVGPWVYAVGERVGWPIYLRLITDETLGRSVSAKEGHWGPPGYHLALLVVLFWPGSLLTGWAVVRAWKEVRMSLARKQVGTSLAHQQEDESPDASMPPHTPRLHELPSPSHRNALLFCLAWALPAWIIFEIVGTKLPHYTMPLYPALALLSARLTLAPEAAAMPRLARAGLWLWFIAGLSLALAPLAFALALLPPGSDSLGIIAPGMITLLIGLLLIDRPLSAGRIGAAQQGAVTLMGCWLIWLFSTLPQLDALWTTRGIARAVGQPLPPLATCGYDEDSLAFFARGRLERIDPSAGAMWLTSHPSGVLIAPAESPIEAARLLDRVHGFNYSKGRWVDLGLYIAEPRAGTPP